MVFYNSVSCFFSLVTSLLKVDVNESGNSIEQYIGKLFTHISTQKSVFGITSHIYYL